MVDGAFQHWQQQQWVTSSGVKFYKHGTQALVYQWQKHMGNVVTMLKNTAL